MTNSRGIRRESRLRQVFAVLGTVLFLFLAPGFVAGLMPYWITGWRVEPPFLGFPPIRVLGILLAALGVPPLLDSFARFAIQGVGTPAPVFPTRHLVVKGLYRYVRNPMYLAVVSVILGQSLVLGNVRLLEYAALVWLGFHLFVLVYEEPTLLESFGVEYEVFCANVPRWLPRSKSWAGSTKER
jgi:protein-S-isoprenylcysteine O-methyltransferase Ste14